MISSLKTTLETRFLSSMPFFFFLVKILLENKNTRKHRSAYLNDKTCSRVEFRVFEKQHNEYSFEKSSVDFKFVQNVFEWYERKIFKYFLEPRRSAKEKKSITLVFLIRKFIKDLKFLRSFDLNFTWIQVYNFLFYLLFWIYNWSMIFVWTYIINTNGTLF